MSKLGNQSVNRRNFMLAASATAFATGCATQSVAGRVVDANLEDKPPNVLFIMVDQHRADCIGCYGNPDVRTPNLDGIAADGVRFNECFCPFPVCTPSRYSALSSLYAYEHAGTSNRCTLRPEIETFPKILRRDGYKTAAVGKMHHTPTYLDVGFDKMVLAEQDGDGRWDDDYHRELMANDLVDINDLEDQRREYREKARPEYWETWGAMPTNLPREFHTTEWIGRNALSFLNDWDSGGNLLYTSFIKPHHPFDPPKELKDLYNPDRLTILPGWTPQCFPHDLALQKGYFPHDKLNEKSLRHVMAYYYATIEHVDMQIGKMIELLKKKGIYDNTMIVYTADHGEYLGYHHLLLKANYMYDPLVRVPSIIKYPQAKQKGRVSNALISNIEFAPTILKQTGCQPASSMHGLDLALDTAGRAIVFAEGPGGNQYMARTKSHKLITSKTPERGLFYDLEKDPLEQSNLYDDPIFRERSATMKRQLEEWKGTQPQPRPYLDASAPQIDQPNVPPRNLSHRPAAMEYFRKKSAAIGINVAT
jgi:arylsulfatase